MRASTDCFLDFVQLGIRTRLGFVIHIDQTSYPAHNKWDPCDAGSFPQNLASMMWPFSPLYPTVKPSEVGVELGDVSRIYAPTFDTLLLEVSSTLFMSILVSDLLD